MPEEHSALSFTTWPARGVSINSQDAGPESNACHKGKAGTLTGLSVFLSGCKCKVKSWGGMLTSIFHPWRRAPKSRSVHSKGNPGHTLSNTACSGHSRMYISRSLGSGIVSYWRLKWAMYAARSKFLQSFLLWIRLKGIAGSGRVSSGYPAAVVVLGARR